VGLLYPYNAGRDDGFLRGRLEPQFLEYIRHSSPYIGICRGASVVEHIDKHSRPGGDAGNSGRRIQIIHFGLRHSDSAVSSGAFSVRHIARRIRKRARPAIRPGGGMVHMADTGSHLAIRRSFVSNFNSPGMDAVRVLRIAALICLRGAEGSDSRRGIFGDIDRMERLPGACLHPPGLSVFQKYLSDHFKERPYSTLQRGKSKLNYL